MTRLLLVIALLFSAVTARATLIPAANLIDWTPGTATGVPGGIPTNRTLYVNAVTGALGGGGTYGGTLATADGSTDDAGAINAMLAACPDDKYVYLPAGTYRVNSPIVLENSKTTLKGAGETTILDIRSSGGVVLGRTDGFALQGGQTTADRFATHPADIFEGSTSIRLTSNSYYSTGQILTIAVRNDDSVPMLVTDGRPYAAQQVVRVTAVPGSNAVVFSPGLFYDMGSGSLAISLSGAVGTKTEYLGLEDMVVDGTNSIGMITGVTISQTFGSWAKGVRVKKARNYPFKVSYAVQCEIRRSRADARDGSGSSGGGILLESCSSTLIEDNIVVDNSPQMELKDGASGNFISRNYFGSGNNVNTNHGPYNQYNCFEGNVAKVGILDDGYFGGSRRLTVFNNYLGYAILKRGAYDATIVGNYFTNNSTQQAYGYPNISNDSYSGSVTPPSTLWADFNMTGVLTSKTDASNGIITLDSPFDLVGYTSGEYVFVYLYWDSFANSQRFRLGTVTGSAANFLADTEGAVNATALPATSTAVTVAAGQSGFQELDLAVEARLTKKGNRWGDNVFDSLGGDSLPNSLAYSSKPQWLTDAEAEFPGLTFNLKPFDPVTPVPPSDSAIPAGYRFLELTAPEFSAASINQAGTELSMATTKPMRVGTGGSGGVTISGNITLTYSRIEGANVIFTTSRVVGDEETIALDYVNPGNGLEDLSGNDLANLTGETVANASIQSAGSYWVQVVELAEAAGTTNLNSAAAIVQPITIPQDGLVTKIRVGVGAGAYGTVNAKVALLNAAGTVLSTGAKAFTASEAYESFTIETVHVTAGSYSIAVFANSNAEPPVALLAGQPDNSAYYAFGTYASWPPTTITADGGNTVKYAVGLRLAPDAAEATGTATATTVNVGTIQRLQ